MSEIEPDALFDTLNRHGAGGPIDAAIVVGSGLGSAIEGIGEIASIPYSQLPGFPAITVSGHEALMVIGKIETKTVACLMGRSHFYETGDSRAMALPLEAVALMGAQHLILTNTAGSVNADIVPGALALISDHINLNGLNPLVGVGGDGGFVSLVDAYDPRINRRFKLAAGMAGVQIREGVYMWFSGPSFETPAEVRMAKMLGADFIGMSTVPETILARRLGLNVTAISAITNFAAGFKNAVPSHGETQVIARQAAITLRKLLRAFFEMRERS